MPKRPPLAKPTMVRMPREMRAELEDLAAKNGLSVSDVVRLAVRKQLAADKPTKPIWP